MVWAAPDLRVARGADEATGGWSWYYKVIILQAGVPAAIRLQAHRAMANTRRPSRERDEAEG